MPREITDATQIHDSSLDSNPEPPLDKHTSTVIFRNGAFLHVFKERSFFLLKRQGLFRQGATSLTFDGTDTTKIPIKFNLFSGKDSGVSFYVAFRSQIAEFSRLRGFKRRVPASSKWVICVAQRAGVLPPEIHVEIDRAYGVSAESAHSAFFYQLLDYYGL